MKKEETNALIIAKMDPQDPNMCGCSVHGERGEKKTKKKKTDNESCV